MVRVSVVPRTRAELWSRSSSALAQLDVPRSDSFWITGAWSKRFRSRPSYFNRSYARLQMHSKSSTSHLPSRVPPQGPFR